MQFYLWPCTSFFMAVFLPVSPSLVDNLGANFTGAILFHNVFWKIKSMKILVVYEEASFLSYFLNYSQIRKLYTIKMAC